MRNRAAVHVGRIFRITPPFLRLAVERKRVPPAARLDHFGKLSRMADRANLIAALKKETEIDFLPAAPEAIAQLESLKVPKEAIAFYREAEPAFCAEIDGVRLWPVKNIVEENTDYVPGCYIREHGYVVFSTTLFG